MDAITLLEQQHQEIEALIAGIGKEAKLGKRTQLVARLARALEAHLRLEREHLYASCAAKMIDRQPVYEASEAQSLLRHAAQALVRTRVTDVRFSARLQSMRRLFANKVKLDERALFQRAKSVLTDEELDRIGASIARGYVEALDRLAA
jgi:hypothetical protein